MNATGSEGDLRVLRHRAEEALRASKPRAQIVKLLEEILARADDDSDASRFAHRQLAELRLEESPWAAALHLRRVVAMSPDDDTAHALMGLCHALQRNYRMAVTAFRRAVALSPGNPWYNHNLGHLLDVALESPSEALGYLRKAHSSRPEQEDVGASLAHCLGRLGQCAEALTITRALLHRHPDHEDLRSLATWLERGAPAKSTSKSRTHDVSAPTIHAIPRKLDATVSPRSLRGVTSTAPEEVQLESQLRRAGATEGEIQRALRIWRDFEAATRARMCPVTAAAIDYAIARVDGATARQREVAARHDVSAQALASRFRELKGALNLSPRDARYR